MDGYNEDYRAFMMGASQTLKEDYLVSFRSGYIMVGADTSGDKFAGVVRTTEVASGSGRLYTDSKYGDTTKQAYVDVQRNKGPFLMYVDHTSGTIYIGEAVYMKTGSTPSVQSATDATNDVYVGRIVGFVTSQNDPSLTEDAYITSDKWAWVECDTLEL